MTMFSIGLAIGVIIAVWMLFAIQVSLTIAKVLDPNKQNIDCKLIYCVTF